MKFWKVRAINADQLLDQFPEIKEYEYKMADIEPGTILFSSDKDGLYIKAKEGIIQVLEIQGENARKMSISDFLRGTKLNAGSIFS